MKFLRILPFVIVLLVSSLTAQPCLDKAKEIAPVLDAETRETYQEKLEEAEAAHLEKPNEANSIIWLGRRTAYLGHYKNAVRQFSSGIVLFPNDARFYRHRGHRYLTLRCFDDAIRDFEKAAVLINGKPDEVEPDGLPNAKNTPTSTLQSNIWYHLGLALYLKGDFKAALTAYKEAQKVSNNNDMRVATTYWQYMTLRRLGKSKEAKKLLKPYGGEIELIENTDYLKLIRLNRNEAKAETLLAAIQGDADTLGSASLGYGIGNYFLYNGDKEKALTIFQKIVAGNQWASFGYIAAETELKH
jgi:tetratricopeptide (TPR) repeat protein